MKKVLLFFLLFFSLELFGATDINATADINQTELAVKSKIQELKKQLQTLKAQVSDENMWIKSYASYQTAMQVKKNLKKIHSRIRYLKRHARTSNDKSELSALIDKQKILDTQINNLSTRVASSSFISPIATAVLFAINIPMATASPWRYFLYCVWLSIT